MTLSVFSYNTHLFGNWYMYKFLNLEYLDSVRFKKIIFNLYSSNIDVICLQEVWCDNFIKVIKDTFGDRYTIYNPKKYSGLIVLSKYKIINSYFEKFNDIQYPDSLANKGFGFITIEHKLRLIDIYFTHTQASYKDSFNNITLKNIYQMKDKLKLSNNSVIICGDLNLEPNMIDEIFPTFKINDYKNTCCNSNILFKRFQKNCKDCKLDYILTDKSFKKIYSGSGPEIIIDNKKFSFKVNNIDCSDHYPVFILLN